MFTFHITDRRLNPHGKSLNNRQRFVERVKGAVKNAVNKQVKTRNLQDTSDAEVSVSRDGIDEPKFHYSSSQGEWDYVLPGNQDYVVGDTLPKPQNGQGGGGSEGSPDGEGEDDFRFYITYQEYLDAILGDLCLPDMIKSTQKETVSYSLKRAGYTTVGATTALALERTMIQGIGRRIALKAPKLARIAELEDELAQTTDETRRIEIEDEISRLRIQAEAISFLEKSDLRFNNFIKQPNPISKAVMFCVDGQTEYLTPTGWQPISQYDGGLVGQYSPDGSMEFVQPNAYVKNDYDASFIAIKAQGIDQMLTPEHRVIFRATDGKLKEMTAAQLERHHNSLAYGFRGSFITHFAYGGEGLKLSDEEIRFHIAFKADGTYQRDHTLRAQFCFKKQRKIDRLKWIMETMRADYNQSEFEARGNTNLYVSTTSRIEKRFGPEWYNASHEQLRLISEEVLHWDGHSKRPRYFSKYKSDVDFVQFAWAANGFGTNVFQDDNGCWVVTRCSYAERSLTSKEPKQITRVESDDKHSYCFNVPSGMLVLRRNDRIFVTGNCLMDVSGSMSEHMKDLAKRFYLLLYVFLTKQYKHVDIVFIRHTHVAAEVDQDTFFNSPETGGTVVSTAYQEVQRVIQERYNVNDWNMYMAQASDGDNSGSDEAQAEALLTQLLPLFQYATYVEVGSDPSQFPSGYIRRESEVWQMFDRIASTFDHVACRKLYTQAAVVEVFRSLFKKKNTA